MPTPRTLASGPLSCGRALLALLCGALALPTAAQFAAATPIDAGGSPVVDLHAADLDGDGDQDILACRSQAPALAWYRNLGGGAFGSAQLLTAQPYAALRARSLDLEGDGDLDLVASVDYYTPIDGSDFQLALYTNQGDGSFVYAHLGDFETSLEGLSVADLEGNGSPDVFFAAYSDATVYVKPAIVGGLGAPQVANTEAVGLRDLLPCDLDGDGDADFVVAAYFLNQVFWCENLDGLGSFGSKQLLDGSANGASSVAAADLDGDGDLDVLSVSALSGVNKVQRYENLGGGSFGSPQLVTSAGFPSAVRAADLDGDLDVDLLVAEFTGVAWYANNGSGQFGARQVISAATLSGRAVDAPDLDGDSMPDVLFASNPGGQADLGWYENLAGAQWENLGGGSLGSAGPPTLAGTGTLVGGTQAALHLVNAPPSALMLAWLSFTSVPAGFFGGTLHANPHSSQFLFAASPSGKFTVATTWPLGVPPGTEAWFQFLIQDTSVLWGITLSNAVKATTP